MLKNAPLLCLWALFFWLPNIANAQYVKSLLELQTDSLLSDLRHHGVDTICVYKDYCVGCVGYKIPPESTCRTKGILIPTYIFWQQAGRTYTRKLDNCSLGTVKANSHDAFWPYFFQYSAQIKREKIKEFVSIDHGSVFAFTFYTKADTTEQYFRGFSLAKAIKHPKMKNKYYRHNIKTHTAHLQKMLSTGAAIFTQP